MGWVGWTNKKAPLELGFVFRSVQSVQAVTLATFSRPDMGIVVSPPAPHNSSHSHQPPSIARGGWR